MRKITALLLSILFLTAISCKNNNNDDDDDDTYGSITVTDAQETFVMLTTATWCGYCGQWGIPTFDEAFEGADGIDKTKINGAALHYSSSDPMYLEMAKTMKDEFGIGGPPNLWLEFDNTYNLQPSGWKTAVKGHQSASGASCGIGLKKESSGSGYKVYVKAKFFQSLTGQYNIAIYATESGIMDTQSGSSQSPHNHKEVLRAEITSNSAWGTTMFTTASPDEYTEEFTYTPAAGVNISNVKFVAVIYKMENGRPVASPNSNTI